MIGVIQHDLVSKLNLLLDHAISQLYTLALLAAPLFMQCNGLQQKQVVDMATHTGTGGRLTTQIDKGIKTGRQEQKSWVVRCQERKRKVYVGRRHSGSLTTQKQPGVWKGVNSLVERDKHRWAGATNIGRQEQQTWSGKYW